MVIILNFVKTLLLFLIKVISTILGIFLIIFAFVSMVFGAFLTIIGMTLAVLSASLFIWNYISSSGMDYVMIFIGVFTGLSLVLLSKIGNKIILSIAFMLLNFGFGSSIVETWEDF